MNATKTTENFDQASAPSAPQVLQQVWHWKDFTYGK